MMDPRTMLKAQRAGGGLPIAVAGLLSLGNLLVPGPARAVLGLPLAFWAPGYCLAILIFGRASWTVRFDGVIRLAVECVLSMASWVLLVLLAYAIHPHMTALSIECCFLALVVATLIRIQLTTRATSAAPRESTLRFAERIPRAPVAAVAVIVLGGALTAGLAYTIPTQQGTTGSTIALAGSAAAADTPLVRDGAESGALSVTISNPAAVTRTYRITATVTGDGAWTTESATVAPGSHDTLNLGGKLPSTACLSRLTVVVSDSTEQLEPLVVYFRGNESGSCGQ